jgi:uncharacterized repeat protein (TIGR03803 family)
LKQVKAIAIVVMVFILTVGAWAGTEKVLYNFTGSSDGAFPFDAGRLVRDSSGVLYGTTVQGGTSGCGGSGCGVVFALTANGTGGWTESVLYSFTGGSDGGIPYDGLIRDGSGTLYGTTFRGGSNDCGTVFALSGTTLSTLHRFTCGADGGNPYTGVIRDKSGNLYGTSDVGGANGHGVAYEISGSGTYRVIYNFCAVSGCLDGSDPGSGLQTDNKGNLFGMTQRGGVGSCSLGCGTVFKLSKLARGWKHTLLHSFTGYPNDGAYPLYGSLTLSTQKIGRKKHNVIFGVTAAGGNTACSAYGCGTVFDLTESNGRYTLTVLYRFAGSGGDGWNPYGTLSNVKGNLFGTTWLGGGTGCGGGGCGTVFELRKKNRVWSETVVYSFTGGGEGGLIFSGVVADSSGDLYGVAQGGGSYGFVYEVVP